MDGRIVYIKYLDSNTQNVPDDINFNKPNLEVMYDNNVEVLIYYDRVNKLRFVSNETDIDDISIRKDIVNSMVKFDLGQPFIDANKMPLTYIEMVQYAALNSNQSNIWDRTHFDKNQEYLLSQSQIYSKGNGAINNIITYYETLSEPKKDFIILPVVIGPKHKEHAINQILYFKDKNPKNLSIYTFDSACNGEGSNQLCKQKWLQGYSETCSYWATNFAILASQYENFESLRVVINSGSFIEDLKKVTSLLIDCKIIYPERNYIDYEHYKVNENTLITGELRKPKIRDINDPKFIDRSGVKGFSIYKSLCKCSTVSNKIDVEEIETPVQNHAEKISKEPNKISTNYRMH